MQDQIRHRYNPEYFYSKAIGCLEESTQSEKQEWLEHPCTKWILYSLEGDLSGIVLQWLGGGYSNQDSSDSTAQQQAKARGMAQAISDIIETIETVKTTTEVNNSELTYSS